MEQFTVLNALEEDKAEDKSVVATALACFLNTNLDAVLERAHSGNGKAFAAVLSFI